MNGIKSEFFVSLAGLRQGTNLSLLLFALCMNGLEDYLCNDCQFINFDDVVMDKCIQLLALLYAYDTIKEELQKAADLMCGFCEKWKLKLNTEKTKVTVFGSGKVDVRKLKFGDNLEVVHCFKYLRITMNHNGSFRNALDGLYKQVPHAMYPLF